MKIGMCHCAPHHCRSGHTTWHQACHATAAQGSSSVLQCLEGSVLWVNSRVL